MIPEPKDVLEIASILEGRIHEHGWDVAPMLGMIVENEQGHLDGVEYPLQPAGMPYSNPAVALLHLAQLTVDMAKEGRLPVADVANHTAGIWFCTEGWMLDNDALVECRIMTVVDCAGRLYRAQRFRGEEPEPAWSMQSTPVVEETRVVVGLRGILGALGTVMSPTAIDIEAVMPQ